MAGTTPGPTAGDVAVLHSPFLNVTVRHQGVLVVHLGNPASAQEWVEQSCARRRIEWSNPVPDAGLSGAILLSTQD